MGHRTAIQRKIALRFSAVRGAEARTRRPEGLKITGSCLSLVGNLGPETRRNPWFWNFGEIKLQKAVDRIQHRA
jgi:hypothetical protein